VFERRDSPCWGPMRQSDCGVSSELLLIDALEANVPIGTAHLPQLQRSSRKCDCGRVGTSIMGLAIATMGRVASTEAYFAWLCSRRRFAHRTSMPRDPRHDGVHQLLELSALGAYECVECPLSP